MLFWFFSHTKLRKLVCFVLADILFQTQGVLRAEDHLCVIGDDHKVKQEYRKFSLPSKEPNSVPFSPNNFGEQNI